MKNFCFAVLLFCMLALCSAATAGDLTNSAEYRAFHWMHSEPVTVEFTIDHPADNASSNANTAEILRRLQSQGWNSLSADTVLFSAFAEFYDCPYLDYGHDIADIFPRDVEIELMREFPSTAQYTHSRLITQALRASGLKPNEAQSLFYNSLDEHLACLLED